MKEAEMASHLLSTTSNPDAKGKGLLDAVEWFLEHYQEKAFELTFSEYIDDFLERKKAKRSVKTLRDITVVRLT